MAWDTAAGASGALSGVSGGAGVGFMVGGPVGAGIGAGVGLLAGASMGFLGQKKKSGGIEHLLPYINERRAQIDAFANDLAIRRMEFSGRLKTLQNAVMSDFVNNLNARYATQGKTFGGGAMASAVGKEATMKGYEGALQETQMARQDLSAVDAARGNLFGSMLGAAQAAGPQTTTYENQPLMAFNQLAGQMAGIGLNEAMSQRRDKMLLAQMGARPEADVSGLTGGVSGSSTTLPPWERMRPRARPLPAGTQNYYDESHVIS